MFFYDKSPVCPLTWFLGKWCLVPRPEWEMALNLLWYPDKDLSGTTSLVYFTFVWGVFRDSAHMGARYFLDSFWVLSHVSPAASHAFGIRKGSGFLISNCNIAVFGWILAPSTALVLGLNKPCWLSWQPRSGRKHFSVAGILLLHDEETISGSLFCGSDFSLQENLILTSERTWGLCFTWIKLV